MRQLLPFVLLVGACSTPDRPEPSNPRTEPRPVPVQTAAPVPVDPEPDVLADEPLARLPAGRYANHWLVITSSKPEPQPLDPALRTLAEDQRDVVAPDVLNSGEFKGLMPCWSITIAGASESREAATRILETVKAAGVDAYIKNAGEYIGPTDAVEAVCNELRSDSGECGNGVRLATRLLGQWYVALSLPESVASAAMQRAPSPRRVDEHGAAWAAPLVVETLGDLALGDAVDVHPVSGAPSRDCTVSGFAATTLGVPHFAADISRPSCGSPAPYAVLSCPDDGAGDERTALVAAPGTDVWAWSLGEETSPSSEVLSRARRLPDVAAVRSVAEQRAAERGEPLKEAVTSWPVAHRAERGHIVQLTWTTGEGFAECGGDDVLVRVAVGVSDTGAALSEGVEVPFAQVTGLVHLPGDALSTLSVSPDFGGAEVGDCGLDIDYCNCPC